MNTQQFPLPDDVKIIVESAEQIRAKRIQFSIGNELKIFMLLALSAGLMFLLFAAFSESWRVYQVDTGIRSVVRADREISGKTAERTRLEDRLSNSSPQPSSTNANRRASTPEIRNLERQIAGITREIEYLQSIRRSNIVRLQEFGYFDRFFRYTGPGVTESSSGREEVGGSSSLTGDFMPNGAITSILVSMTTLVTLIALIAVRVRTTRESVEAIASSDLLDSDFPTTYEREYADYCNFVAQLLNLQKTEVPLLSEHDLQLAGLAHDSVAKARVAPLLVRLRRLQDSSALITKLARELSVVKPSGVTVRSVVGVAFAVMAIMLEVSALQRNAWFFSSQAGALTSVCLFVATSMNIAAYGLCGRSSGDDSDFVSDAERVGKVAKVFPTTGSSKSE